MQKFFTISLLLFSFLSNGQNLKNSFEPHFKIGSALNIEQQLIKRKNEFTQLIKSQFNSIVAENAMKWDALNPKPGIYNFKLSDKIVDFAHENQMEMVGHVLFWHNQTPDWLFKDPKGNQVSKEVLLERMRQHIRVLNKRYENKIHAWDVVNEALNEDGSLRDSPWKQILGEDWVQQAFKIAHEELPATTQLIYNDYNLYKPAKLKGLVNIINAMQDVGIRIDAVGAQAHWGLNYPSQNNIQHLIHTLHQAKVKIHFSELDIEVLPKPKKFNGGAEITELHKYNDSIDPYRQGLSIEMQERLAQRYQTLFKIFVAHSDKIERVNFWGLTDEFSWKNFWPVPNRTNHPLLFDREGKPKKAFFSVLSTASSQ